MPGWIGPWEIAIFLVVALLIFGPKRLPEMGRSLGKGMRDFKKAVSGADDEREAMRKAVSLDADDEVEVEVVETTPTGRASTDAA
jgi:sec-independent protein translocase protein TatA